MTIQTGPEPIEAEVKVTNLEVLPELGSPVRVTASTDGPHDQITVSWTAAAPFMAPKILDRYDITIEPL